MNELILAVDTTHEFGSLALLRGTEVIEEVLLHSPEGFGQVLFGRMAQLLDRHGHTVAEVDCFAATSGPGSFTGVRIGLAAVKGLAEATGKPVVAISNLRVMAAFGTAPLRAVVLDARRGEVYGAVYDREGAGVISETVTPFTAWLDTLPPGNLEFLSLDFAPFAPALAATRFAAAPITTVPRALAAAVGRIAAEQLCAGQAQDPAAIDANYVRRSDAELFWKEY
ncbi:MAG TPA: tRNA (adenosine(37)-N6)-threonylcarbamoyltransferase complex dimerization subunit type 1 TsaB [Bryobacteraceae bacterium]|nr:tRNA (adenosine(37)-N6)-threonylcarbamoyltransferase complex dimerization subunit type 1 TsaB [Bryobacteraceae bacterium]